MVARLRKRGKAGIVAFIVVLALGGSAILAYAITAPSGGVYPVIAAKVSSSATIGGPAKTALTKCSVGITRKSTGSTKGRVTVTEAKGTAKKGHVFKSTGITLLDVNPTKTLAHVQADGTLDKVAGFSADVVVTTSPATCAITISQANTVQFAASGPAVKGKIKIK